MAEQRVQFTIGSIFKGEGFKQAQAAVSKVNSAVKTSAAMIGSLASSVGILDAKYAKATSAVTGLTSALMSGNPIMAAFGVAMTGASLVVAKFNEQLEEQKKLHDQLIESINRTRDKIVQTWSSEQTAEMEKFNEQLKEIGDSYDKITKDANDFAVAANKLAGTKSAGKDIQMQIDKLLNGREHKGADKQLEDAKADLAIALKKSADAEEQAQTRIDMANKSRLDAQGKIETVNLQIAEAEYKYQENLSKLNDLGDLDARIKQQLVSDNEALRKKITELNKQRTAAEDAIVKADRDLTQATEEKKNVVLQSKLTRLQAEDRVKDAENAVADELKRQKEEVARKAAEEEAAKQKNIDALNRLAEQREKEREQIKAQLQKELDAAQRNLDNARSQLGTGRSGGGDGGGSGGGNEPVLTEREIQTSDAWNRSLISRGLIMGTMGNFFNNGGVNQIGERLNLQGAANQQQAYDSAKEQALNQGKSLADAERAGRNAARTYRDAASSREANQLAKDAAELAKLNDKEARGQKLSPRERQRQEDLERQQAAKDEEIRRAQEQAQNIKNLPNNVAKMAENVDTIAKKLEKLGLK